MSFDQSMGKGAHRLAAGSTRADVIVVAPPGRHAVFGSGSRKRVHVGRRGCAATKVVRRVYGTGL